MIVCVCVCVLNPDIFLVVNSLLFSFLCITSDLLDNDTDSFLEMHGSRALVQIKRVHCLFL